MNFYFCKTMIHSMVLKKHKRLFNEKSPFYPQATPHNCFLQHNQTQVHSPYVLSELINHSQANTNLYSSSFHKNGSTWRHYSAYEYSFKHSNTSERSFCNQYIKTFLTLTYGHRIFYSMNLPCYLTSFLVDDT